MHHFDKYVIVCFLAKSVVYGYKETLLYCHSITKIIVYIPHYKDHVIETVFVNSKGWSFW